MIVVGYVVASRCRTTQSTNSQKSEIVENTVCMCNMVSLSMGIPRLSLSQLFLQILVVVFFFQADLHFDLL